MSTRFAGTWAVLLRFNHPWSMPMVDSAAHLLPKQDVLWSDVAGYATWQTRRFGVAGFLRITKEIG